MRTYRLGWLIAAVTLVLVGNIAAAVAAPVELLDRFTAVAFLGAAAGVAVWLLARQTDTSHRWPALGTDVVWGAGAAGGSAGALLGLAETLGVAGAVCAMVAVGLAAPWVTTGFGRLVRNVARRCDTRLDDVVRGIAAASPGFAFVHIPSGEAAPVTDDELCQAWRASAQALAASRSWSEYLRVVERRGLYLQEMERRHPGGFAALFALGQPDPEDALAYLAQQPDRTVDWVIRWDELTGGQDA